MTRTETIEVLAPARQAVAAAVMAQVHAKVEIVSATVTGIVGTHGYRWVVSYRRTAR